MQRLTADVQDVVMSFLSLKDVSRLAKSCRSVRRNTLQYTDLFTLAQNLLRGKVHHLSGVPALTTSFGRGIFSTAGGETVVTFCSLGEEGVIERSFSGVDDNGAASSSAVTAWKPPTSRAWLTRARCSFAQGARRMLEQSAGPNPQHEIVLAHHPVLPTETLSVPRGSALVDYGEHFLLVHSSKHYEVFRRGECVKLASVTSTLQRLAAAAFNATHAVLICTSGTVFIVNKQGDVSAVTLDLGVHGALAPGAVISTKIAIDTIYCVLYHPQQGYVQFVAVALEAPGVKQRVVKPTKSIEGIIHAIGAGEDALVFDSCGFVLYDGVTGQRIMRRETLDVTHGADWRNNTACTAVCFDRTSCTLIIQDYSKYRAVQFTIDRSVML